MGLVEQIVPKVSAALEIVGISAIALGALLATLFAGRNLARKTEAGLVYADLRRQLSRGILLGLEYLVAADIIDTRWRQRFAPLACSGSSYLSGRFSASHWKWR